MILFTGFGPLGVFIWFGVSGLGMNLYGTQVTIEVVILIVAALVVWPVGWLMNRKKKPVIVYENGKEKIEYYTPHTVFWIPMEYTGFAMSAIGLLSVLLRCVLV